MANSDIHEFYFPLTQQERIHLLKYVGKLKTGEYKIETKIVERLVPFLRYRFVPTKEGVKKDG